MSDQNMADKKQEESVQDSTSPKPDVEQVEEQAPAEAPKEQPAEEQAPTGDESPTSSARQDEEGGETEGKKPSRLERRVDKLVSKLKETSQPTDNTAMTDVFGNEPLVKPEDYTEGLDPTELEARLEQRRAQDRELIKRELEQDAEWKAGVKEHLEDSEKTKEMLGDNADLDKLVAETYEAQNFLIDPRTGQTVFSPRVKMSDIYNNLKKVMDKNGVEAAAEVSGKIVQQAGEQAIPPSVSNDQPSTEDGEAFDKAKSTGKTQDWAEVLKKRGVANNIDQ